MIIELLKMSFSYKPRKTILILIQLLLSFFTISVAMSTFDASGKSVKRLNTITKDLYKIHDNYFDEEEDIFFARYDNVNVLQNLFLWENSNDNFEYIVMNRQAVYTEDVDLPIKFEQGYSSGTSTPFTYQSLQANINFFEYFDIQLSNGDYFSPEDYILDDEIPILLGNNYTNYFKINQKIKISYLGIELNCYIKGFISSESYINNGQNIEYLNDMIVLPSLELNEINNPYFALKLYLDKCSGYVYSTADINWLQNFLTQKCVEEDILPFTFEGCNGFYLSMWGLEGEQLQRVLVILLTLVCATSIICMSINLSVKIARLKKHYAIYIMNGVERKDIVLSIISEIIILNLIAVFAAYVLSLTAGFQINFIKLFLSIIIMTAISSIYPIFCFRTINISTSIRGKE